MASLEDLENANHVSDNNTTLCDSDNGNKITEGNIEEIAVADTVVADEDFNNGNAAFSCNSYLGSAVNDIATYERAAEDFKSSTEMDEAISANKTAEDSFCDVQSVWKKLSDSGETYLWNIETGVMQYNMPDGLCSSKTESDSDSLIFNSVDSSLADLESAAFRYASLAFSNDDSVSDSSSKWAGESDSGCMFSVRSLGWLPIDNFSSDPETSSADVNACIRHLSRSHGQIMDGIGAWGDGKNLLLLIENEFLKLLDPLNQTILQTQPIKQIRIWGVGHDSVHDFAYVAKDPGSKKYKCHVFRCDASAKAIARELHQVCENLSFKHKKQMATEDDAEKEKLAMTTPIPVPKSDPGQLFSVMYLGNKEVTSENGINTIKNVIRDVTTDGSALCVECTAKLTSNALVLTSNENNEVLVDCRMRCLSFMGIGDDISLFAFISVVANVATCHVLQCNPNAVKFALSVQEACVLRYQKAVDSSANPNTFVNKETATSSGIRHLMKKLFTSKKK